MKENQSVNTLLSQWPQKPNKTPTLHFSTHGLCICAMQNNFNREFYGKPKELQIEIGKAVKERNMKRKPMTQTLETHKN